MTEFKDHFSGHAETYAKYRPRYPEELFSYLASLLTTHDLALDCATGNGQAALGLAPFFREIIATDASQAQLGFAFSHPKITYRLAQAEQLPVLDNSVDLLTVATGVHWFDLDRFFLEARRVLKNSGVIALWSYYAWTSNCGLDRIISDYEQKIVGDYWPNEFQKRMGSFYAEMAVPFDEISAPAFEIPLQVDQQWVMGYLKSWSATQRYMQARKSDPTQLIAKSLSDLFAKAQTTADLNLKLALRVGRKSDSP